MKYDFHNEQKKMLHILLGMAFWGISGGWVLLYIPRLVRGYQQGQSLR
jgi:hypothetical protein